MKLNDLNKSHSFFLHNLNISLLKVNLSWQVLHIKEPYVHIAMHTLQRIYFCHFTL